MKKTNTYQPGPFDPYDSGVRNTQPASTSLVETLEAFDALFTRYFLFGKGADEARSLHERVRDALALHKEELQARERLQKTRESV